MNEKSIDLAVKAFKDASASEAAALDARREIQIDIAIAERAGDDIKKKRLGMTAGDLTSEWYATFEAKKASAYALCGLLDIAPHELKNAL